MSDEIKELEDRINELTSENDKLRLAIRLALMDLKYVADNAQDAIEHLNEPL